MSSAADSRPRPSASCDLAVARDGRSPSPASEVRRVVCGTGRRLRSGGSSPRRWADAPPGELSREDLMTPRAPARRVGFRRLGDVLWIGLLARERSKRSCAGAWRSCGELLAWKTASSLRAVGRTDAVEVDLGDLVFRAAPSQELLMRHEALDQGTYLAPAPAPHFGFGGPAGLPTLYPWTTRAKPALFLPLPPDGRPAGGLRL